MQLLVTLHLRNSEKKKHNNNNFKIGFTSFFMGRSLYHIILGLAVILSEIEHIGMRKIAESYSSKLSLERQKQFLQKGKTYYQNHSIRKHQSYHNKTIPLGCRDTRKSYRGLEIKKNNYRKKIREEYKNN